MTPGKNVRYIILNADAEPEFPQTKVILAELYQKGNHHYDKEKYLELLTRAFKNLFPFEMEDLDEFIARYSTEYPIQSDLKHFF
jgi:hypothetical protein